MKIDLHLADAGLVLADLSARLYNGAGVALAVDGLAITPLETSTSYELDGLPSPVGGLTLTLEQPEGVFSAYRFGAAESQPAGVIIPIREVLADPLEDLAVKAYQDGIWWHALAIEQLAEDGEYFVSGWDTPSPLGERWSVRWEYAGSVFSVRWKGSAPSPRYAVVAARAGTAGGVIATGGSGSGSIEAVEVS